MSMTNKLVRKNLKLQTMPSLVTKAARLWHDLVIARKEIEKQGLEMASEKKVKDDIGAAKKKVARLVTFVIEARENCFLANALMRKRDVEMVLLR